jgi:hypothetical protein
MTQYVWAANLPTRYDPPTQSYIPAIDLKPASEFGVVTAIASGRLDTNDPQPQIDSIQQFVANSPEFKADDYVLAIGDLVMCAALISAACFRYGKVNVLKWDKHNRRYDAMEIAL